MFLTSLIKNHPETHFVHMNLHLAVQSFSHNSSNEFLVNCHFLAQNTFSKNKKYIK